MAGIDGGRLRNPEMVGGTPSGFVHSKNVMTVGGLECWRRAKCHLAARAKIENAGKEFTKQ